jgi:hypothetical protein
MMDDDRFQPFAPTYTRRPREDRNGLLDKLFRTHENHAAIERWLVGFVLFVGAVIVIHNATVHGALAAQKVVTP